MKMLIAVLPVIAILSIGFFCRVKNIISEEGINGLQALVINITLPVALFSNIYKTRITPDTILLVVTFFCAVMGAVYIGKLIGSRSKAFDKYMPFMIASYEAGMLGYALLGILVGSDHVARFAIMDIGHMMAVYTIYLAMLKNAGGEKQTVKDALYGLATTPVVVGVFLGVIVSVSGLGAMVEGTEFGELLNSLCAFVSGPTGAVILVVVGYRMKFKGVNWKAFAGLIGLRALVQTVFGVIIILGFRMLGGLFAEPLTIISAIVMLILPTAYILPIYIREEESQNYYSSVLSADTIVTVILFMVVAGVVLL